MTHINGWASYVGNGLRTLMLAIFYFKSLMTSYSGLKKTPKQSHFPVQVFKTSMGQSYIQDLLIRTLLCLHGGSLAVTLVEHIS